MCSPTEKPEHCFACFRLIRPGQACYLTIENTALCADRALNEGLIRVRDDSAIEVMRDRLVIQCGKVEVEVLPGEIRHLVNALAEADDSTRIRGRTRRAGTPA